MSREPIEGGELKRRFMTTRSAVLGLLPRRARLWSGGEAGAPLSVLPTFFLTLLVVPIGHPVLARWATSCEARG